MSSGSLFYALIKYTGCCMLGNVVSRDLETGDKRHICHSSQQPWRCRKSLPPRNFQYCDIDSVSLSNSFIYPNNSSTLLFFFFFNHFSIDKSLNGFSKCCLLLLPPESMVKPSHARPGPSKHVRQGEPMMDGPWKEVIYNLSLPCVSVRRPRDRNWRMPTEWRDRRRQRWIFSLFQ